MAKRRQSHQVLQARPRRLSVERCRALLSDDAIESDLDIELLRDQLYEIAQVWIDGGMPGLGSPSTEPQESLSDDDQIEVEERAAVQEFDGGLSRLDAEQAALVAFRRNRGDEVH